MVKIGLQIKATLEFVTGLKPDGEDFRYYLKLKCANCGEVSDRWQYVTLAESQPTKALEDCERHYEIFLGLKHALVHGHEWQSFDSLPSQGPRSVPSSSANCEPGCRHCSRKVLNASPPLMSHNKRLDRVG